MCSVGLDRPASASHLHATPCRSCGAGLRHFALRPCVALPVVTRAAPQGQFCREVSAAPATHAHLTGRARARACFVFLCRAPRAVGLRLPSAAACSARGEMLASADELRWKAHRQNLEQCLLMSKQPQAQPENLVKIAWLARQCVGNHSTNRAAREVVVFHWGCIDDDPSRRCSWPAYAEEFGLLNRIDSKNLGFSCPLQPPGSRRCPPGHLLFYCPSQPRA